MKPTVDSPIQKPTESVGFWARLFGRSPQAPKLMDANIVFASDVGCIRTNNEDSFGYVVPAEMPPRLSPGLVAVVADGMGGHACGEYASRLAVDFTIDAYKRSKKSPEAALSSAVTEANNGVFRESRKDKEKENMGTTVTAIAIVSKNLYLAHVGDSRLYLVRNGKAYQLSTDHTVINEWLAKGMIDPAEARTHPDRNVLSRAVGTKPHVEVESWPEPMQLRGGDCLLLCSDGLHDLVNDDEIGTYVQESPSGACDALVSLAKSRGAPDNVTVGVVQVGNGANG
jgi:protein phosphatase